MAHVVVKCEAGTQNEPTWIRNARSSFDVGAALASALTPFWTIERELDPFGDLTVIVLPVDDATARPCFILYEADAVVQVSTFVGDDWRCRQTFRTCQRAVDAIINAAATVSRPACQVSSTSRGMQSAMTTYAQAGSALAPQ